MNTGLKMTDKNQLAIINYAETQHAVKSLTKRISECFYQCVFFHYGSDYKEDKKPCLLEGYCKVDNRKEDFYGDIVDYLHDEKESCKFCLEANELIKERKVARQSFGRAKARITKLAKYIKRSELSK